MRIKMEKSKPNTYIYKRKENDSLISDVSIEIRVKNPNKDKNVEYEIANTELRNLLNLEEIDFYLNEIVIDNNEKPVIIFKEVYSEITNYLKKFDHEEGGVLFGFDNVVTSFLPLLNISNDFLYKYKINPDDWLKIIKIRKNQILGTVHSHIHKLPTPSDTDVRNLSLGYTFIYSKKEERLRAFKIYRKKGYEEVNIKQV
jgi:proteasome lid subunit RPN8/RPN11